MSVAGDPSEHVAEACCQPAGTFSATEYPDAGVATNSVCDERCAFVSLPSSSSVKELGLIPPLALNRNGVTASGCASLTTVIAAAAGLKFVNVHSTVSPGPMSIA